METFETTVPLFSTIADNLAEVRETSSTSKSLIIGSRWEGSPDFEHPLNANAINVIAIKTNILYAILNIIMSEFKT